MHSWAQDKVSMQMVNSGPVTGTDPALTVPLVLQDPPTPAAPLCGPQLNKHPVYVKTMGLCYKCCFSPRLHNRAAPSPLGAATASPVGGDRIIIRDLRGPLCDSLQPPAVSGGKSRREQSVHQVILTEHILQGTSRDWGWAGGVATI